MKTINFVVDKLIDSGYRQLAYHLIKLNSQFIVAVLNLNNSGASDYARGYMQGNRDASKRAIKSLLDTIRELPRG